MDTLLVIVTGVSLALAAAMGMVLARLMRDERERSDARVQLLEELAAGTGAANYLRQPSPAPAAAPAPVAQDVRPAFLRPLSASPSKSRRTLADLPLRETPPAEVAGVHDLFHEAHEPSAWPRRVAVAGSLAVLISLTVFGWNQMRGTAAPPAPVDAAAAPATPALELLSLRHARDGNTLTVTGLVQNPREGGALSNVQATLFVFGPNGTFLTSGRAALDFTSLAPGDESPFVIRVPVSGNVARYRVGFRGRDDRVLAHVDRRTDQVGRTF